MSKVGSDTFPTIKIKPKVAVLIADSCGFPFDDIREAVHPKIWQDLINQNIDVFYIRGLKPSKIQETLNSLVENIRYSKLWPIQNVIDKITLFKFNVKLPKMSIEGNVIEVQIVDSLRTLGVKMITCYKYCLDENYDFVFKTTLSSVVDPIRFMQKLEELPTDDAVYAGTPVNFGSHPFASGSNTLLNRSALIILFKNIKKWNHGFLDDVAMGRLFEGCVEIRPIKSLHINSLEQLDLIHETEFAETVHFRCKSASIPRNDVEIMNQLKIRMQKIK
jgi:hypothetical protein